MSENTIDIETLEDVLYGYRNEKNLLVWTPNISFAQAQANKYGTFQVYIEKI